MNDFDDLSKSKEEQDERLDGIRHRKQELENQHLQLENDCIKQADDITKMGELITDAEQKTKDKS